MSEQSSLRRRHFTSALEEEKKEGASVPGEAAYEDSRVGESLAWSGA